MKRKGIILAGGSGTRLFPVTQVISKQLLPVFDKPMIYYPLSTLMLADIREMLIISSPRDTQQFVELLGDGSKCSLKICYAVQPSPDGLAQALIIAEKFLQNSSSALVLGDNIFYGHSFIDLLNLSNTRVEGATIFAYAVKNPNRYGVVEIDNNNKPIKLIEKPIKTNSKLAITGLYFFDKFAPQYVKQLKPSSRGEYEITELNKI